MTTLEQVEKLCEKAHISYEEAKAALDAANGDLLDAIIFLEKQGKINAPTGDGFYSSQKNVDVSQVSYNENNWGNHNHTAGKKNSFFAFLKTTWEFGLKIIRKGNINSFEVLKGQEIKASFPITALAILLVFFWVTIPLIIIGLFFGLRYRFVGPDFSSSTVNDAMNSAAEAAENLKKSINI